MIVQLTDEQLERFRHNATEDYISDMIIKFEKNFPHLKKTFANEVLRNCFTISIDKAKKSGFTQRGPVQFYISLLITFGSGFETDPQYLWISQEIQKNRLLSQLHQTEALLKKTRGYFRNIAGEDETHLFECASKLNQFDVNDIFMHDINYQQIHDVLEDIYPQKYINTSRSGINLLIDEGIIKARTVFGFNLPNHIVMVILFMFILGHQFEQDPFCGWINNDKQLQYREDSQLLANKLQQRAKTWLQAAIRNNTL